MLNFLCQVYFRLTFGKLTQVGKQETVCSQKSDDLQTNVNVELFEIIIMEVFFVSRNCQFPEFKFPRRFFSLSAIILSLFHFFFFSFLFIISVDGFFYLFPLLAFFQLGIHSTLSVCDNAITYR